jgi:hypothetical protein
MIFRVRWFLYCVLHALFNFHDCFDQIEDGSEILEVKCRLHVVVDGGLSRAGKIGTLPPKPVTNLRSTCRASLPTVPHSYSALACQPLHFTAYINDNTKLDETMDMTSSVTRQEP